MTITAALALRAGLTACRSRPARLVGHDHGAVEVGGCVIEIVGEGLFQAGDGCDLALGRAIRSERVGSGHRFQPGAEGVWFSCPLGEGLGAMEREDAARAVGCAIARGSVVVGVIFRWSDPLHARCRYQLYTLLSLGTGARCRADVCEEMG